MKKKRAKTQSILMEDSAGLIYTDELIRSFLNQRRYNVSQRLQLQC